MSEYDYETTFTFRKPKHFWVELNKQISIKDRTTLNASNRLYHLVFFSNMPTDFNTWINSNGCLDNTAIGNAKITSGYTDKQFHLGVEWLDDGENGFTLFLDELVNDEPTDVEIPISEHTELLVKGVALCKTTGDRTGNDYVVAYARASNPIRCQNYISLMYGSSFVGHQSCGVVNNG